jgi:prevent-host-death family protein
MKPTRWKQDLVPVQDLRAGLARWIAHVDKSGRPLVVTQRGRAAVVLLSPAMLDEVEEQRQLVAKVLRGLAQVKERALTGDGGLWRKAKKRIAEAAQPGVVPTAPRDGDGDEGN